MKTYEKLLNSPKKADEDELMEDSESTNQNANNSSDNIDDRIEDDFENTFEGPPPSFQEFAGSWQGPNL